MKLRAIVYVLFFTIVTCVATTVLADNTLPPPYLFPDNEISFGFYDRDFFTANIYHPPSPIYWKASTEANGGVTLKYQHLIFHTAKHFSTYLGSSLSGWVRGDDSIVALTAFFAMRFWLFRSTNFNPYIIYSIAEPTILSNNHFGHANLGKNFLFQDTLGVGAAFGAKQNINFEATLVHYSNGDIFPQNSGLDVPIVLSLGYSFP